MIDVCIKILFQHLDSYRVSNHTCNVVAVLTAGLGGGIYLIANLGPGPRDGLMTGLQRKLIFL